MEELDNLELEYNQFKNNERPSNTNAGADIEKGLDTKKYFERSITDNSTYGKKSYSIPSYEEETITLKDYYDTNLRDYFTWASVLDYIRSLFPVVNWLPFYNPKWFLSDLIAGITVGTVLVPQSMSYAQIATLPPEYGLYSSFIGALVYSFFATSKDVCIGPVAVMSEP